MRPTLTRLVLLSIVAAVLAPAAAVTSVGRVLAPTASAGPTTIYLGPGHGTGDCAAPTYTTGDLAVAVAAASSGDTLHLCAGTYAVSAGISFDKVLTFVGDGSANTIVDGSEGVTPTTTGIFQSTTTGTISFSAMTIRNGNRPASQGGAISAPAHVLLSNIRLVDNGAFACGAVRAGSVTMTGATFERNWAQGNYHAYGGALCLGRGYYGTVAGPSTIAASSFTGNHQVGTGDSRGYGGAIFSSDAGSELTIRDSLFLGNSARGVTWSVAGAVYAESRITVSGSEFIDNVAHPATNGGWGGAIDAETGIDVTSSTFVGNVASGGGGAIELANGATIVNSTFLDNSAGSGYGGALHFWGGSDRLWVANVTFSGNTAGTGGAIASEREVASVWEPTDFTSGNTIFATAADTCYGLLVDRGGNIAVSDGTAPNGCVDPAVTASQTVADPASLALGALANNGGRTRTLAIGAGSIARVSGVVAICVADPVANLDQRGYGRHATDGTPACSSGAYEYDGRAPAAPVIDPPVDSGPGDGAFAAPLAQTITFSLTASGKAGSKITLTGTASSGLPLTYTSSTPSVCTVSGAVLSLNAVGTCTVAANQAGTTSYAAASTVTRTILVSAKPALDQRLFGVGANGKWLALPVPTVARGATVINQLLTGPSFAGRRAELWTKATGGTWVRAVTRTLDRAGSATYRLTAVRALSLKWRLLASGSKPALWSQVAKLALR